MLIVHGESSHTHIVVDLLGVWEMLFINPKVYSVRSRDSNVILN